MLKQRVLVLGAGNIIFPPSAGMAAGEAVWSAALGFRLTAVGLPLLTVTPDRQALMRYGLNPGDVQDTVATAIGGAVAPPRRARAIPASNPSPTGAARSSVSGCSGAPAIHQAPAASASINAELPSILVIFMPTLLCRPAESPHVVPRRGPTKRTKGRTKGRWTTNRTNLHECA